MLRDAVLIGTYLSESDTTRRTFVPTARWVAGLS